jgi:hypothetical protein
MRLDTIWTLRHRCENNIKIDLKERRLGDVVWICDSGKG